jgi:hypothetical protein
MVSTVPSIEQTTVDGDEGVIKVGFQAAVTMGIYNLQRVWVGDGNVIWGKTDKGSYSKQEDKLKFM